MIFDISCEGLTDLKGSITNNNLCYDCGMAAFVHTHNMVAMVIP